MNNSHLATVVRDTKRKTYEAKKSYSGTDAYILSHSELVETKKLWSGQLDSPVLSVDDELYLSKLEETVKIKKVIRSTDNGFIYHAYDKFIDDEISNDSKALAEEEKIRLEQEMEQKAEETEMNKNKEVVEKYEEALEQIITAINELKSELKSE